jgi:iron complex transport system substrate-binding protein
LPSATEIVAALGMEANLVGVSHGCDHPPGVRWLPVLSESEVDTSLPGAAIDRSVRGLVRDGLSVYRVRDEALRAARPDVVLTQDQCEVCAVSLSDVEAAVRCLGLVDTSVCSLHPSDLATALNDFERVAQALGVPEAGRALVQRVRGRLSALEARVRGRRRPRVALVEWLDPPMIAGGWMPELARIAGGEPVIVREPSAFREVTWALMAREDPDVVVLLPCGFDVERTARELEQTSVRAGLARISALTRGQVWIVDGNAYFNRPGPRLADSAELLGALLHPEGADLPSWVRSRACRRVDPPRAGG